MLKTIISTVFLCLILTSCYTPSASSRPVHRPTHRNANQNYQWTKRLPSRNAYQVGEASWYGDEFHGRQTSSGEVYDMYNLTAAHPSLPFGTVVRVTNFRNRRSVVVRINDRGPFLKGRIIDLSYAAAARLGMLMEGVTKVRIDIL